MTSTQSEPQSINAKIDFTNVDQQIIMLWKLNKYSINSIAVQTRTNKEFVNKSISKFRRGVKALW